MSLDPPRLDLVVVTAVCRRGDQVLLVYQQGADDPGPAWVLPGGVVEAGELLHQALAREVREETGLEIELTGSLLYVVQIENAVGGLTVAGELPAPDGRLTVYAFEVTGWRGEVQPNDPDELILDAQFFSIREAVEQLEQHSWRAVREPSAAYLRGSAAPGTVWQYRRQATGTYQLASRLGDWQEAPPVRQPARPSAPSDASQERAKALFVLGCLVALIIVAGIVIIGLITVFHHNG